MSKAWLISGSPGCGKTTWILKAMKAHQGSCGYLRLTNSPTNELAQLPQTEIDYTFLKDQIPHLQNLSGFHKVVTSQNDDLLVFIELPVLQAHTDQSTFEIYSRIKNQLESLGLYPEKHLHFGREPELPSQDILEFTKLESCSHELLGKVWDPQSLNTFWFELVNGAYGDVYRAKALMNLPDGQSIFFNWIISQECSQFLPLRTISPPNGRPERTSELVIQGIGLNCTRIQSTIDLCLLNNAILEMHQLPLRDRHSEAIQAI